MQHESFDSCASRLDQLPTCVIGPQHRGAKHQVNYWWPIIDQNNRVKEWETRSQVNFGVLLLDCHF